MKPFYFSTKSETAQHPLIDSLPAIKAEIMLSIKNHNSKYNFEHISYYLNPYIHDYGPSCKEPVKNSKVEFIAVYLEKIVKLLQSFNYFDDVLFISKMVGKVKSNEDCYDYVDEWVIAENIQSKYPIKLVITGKSSETEYLHVATDETFYLFKKVLIKRTESINIYDAPKDWLELFQKDDKIMELEVSKDIDKYLNKDIIYVGYTDINKDFLSLLNPKRLFTIHPYFAE